MIVFSIFWLSVFFFACTAGFWMMALSSTTGSGEFWLVFIDCDGCSSFFMEVSAAFVCFCDICMATSGSEPVSGSQCPIETRRRAAKGHWDPETGCKAKIMGKIERLPWILMILLENQRFWTCGNHLSWGGVGTSFQNDEIWWVLKAFHKESGRLLESWKSGGFLDISEHASKSMKINQNQRKSTKITWGRRKPIKIAENL